MMEKATYDGWLRHTRVITLTYAEHARSIADWRYTDVQRFMKRLRKYLASEGFERIRFFCSGEYGPLRGRLHWHMILFGSPPWPAFERADLNLTPPLLRPVCEAWPWGFISVDVLRPKGARYFAKYMTKDRECILRMSREQALGSAYCGLIAQKMRLNGVNVVPHYLRIDGMGGGEDTAATGGSGWSSSSSSS